MPAVRVARPPRPLAAIETTVCRLVVLALMLGARGLGAQESAWEFERLHLVDGSTLEGLLLDEREQTVEFAVIIRPPGRPMQAIIAPVPAERINRIEQLPKPRRQVLERRFREFRNRARIEADRMDALTLERKPSRVFPSDAWHYDGDWFLLVTTLDERAARRCIVRVEQVFRAYRHLLPPQRRPRRKLEIVLAGSSAEYRRLLELHRLNTTAPALYLPQANRILASTDLQPLADEMAEAAGEHEALRDRLERQLEEFPEQFAAQAARLREKGYRSDEITLEKRAREAALQRELKSLEARIVAAERRNEATFAQHSHRAFGRLYHEAFHAYLQSYVMEDAARRVPRWLNEGLAQIFEHGQLDGDYLRIDAPSPVLAQRLQDDLRRGGGLPLRDVLSARASDFHGRGGDEQTAQQLYSHAWGLAYYLLYGKGLKLDEMLRSLPQGEQDPAQQLAQLAGMPLEELQWRWRDFVREL